MDTFSRLVNDIALTPARRAEYQRSGALVLKNLFSDAGMNLLSRAIDEDVNASDHPDKFVSGFSRYSNEFLARTNRLQGIVGELDPILQSIVGEEIVLTQGIMLHMEQGKTGFKWHFDEFSFSFVRPQDMGFTLWIPLIPIETAKQNGGLYWVNQNDFSARARMQQWAHFEKKGLLNESEDPCGQAKAAQYGDTWVGDLDRQMLNDLRQETDLQLGDAFVFDRYTWHKSSELRPGPLPARTAIVLRVVSADARFDKELFENVMARRADQDAPLSFGDRLAGFDHGTSMREAVAAGVSIWTREPVTLPAVPIGSPADPSGPAREGDLQQELVLAAASQRGLKVTDVSDIMACKAAILELNGHKELLVQGILASSMNLQTKSFCDFKQLTKILFDRLAIPSPKSLLFTEMDEAQLRSFMQPGQTYVCKPQVAANGAGVEMGISSIDQVHGYCQRNGCQGDAFLLEEQIEGEDLRLQVIGGRIVAACVRVPAHVVGDGVSTLLQLVERRQQVVQEQNPSDKLELDRASYALLEEQQLTLGSVPEAGRHVQLKTVANIGQGGVAIDVTDEIHPGYEEWVRRIVEFCDASYFALDLICLDHTKDPEANSIALELNGLAEWTHHSYSEGRTHDLGKVVLDAAFGE